MILAVYGVSRGGLLRCLWELCGIALLKYLVDLLRCAIDHYSAHTPSLLLSTFT